MTRSLEQLCVHHSLAGFSCGDRESDALAEVLLKAVRRRESFDFHTVAVVDADDWVLGLVSTTDLLVPAEHPEQPDERWLFYHLLAVRREHQGGPVTRQLINEVDAISAQRMASELRYTGELASPGRGGNANERTLERFLLRRGFEEMGPMGFWHRRRGARGSGR